MDNTYPNQNPSTQTPQVTGNPPTDPTLGTSTPAPSVPPAPATPEPIIPQPAYMEPSIATPPVMPVPSGDDKPKSSMLVKVSLILLIVVLVAALGYIAYAKFISPPTKIAPVLEEQVTEETPSQYVPAEETVPAEGEQPVEEMIVTEEVTTQTEVTTTEPTPEPTP